MSVMHINQANFQEMVMEAKKPVMLDFWAPWCGPCRMIAPVIDEIAQERPDVLVGKVNVDEEPELARAFGVMSIPMLAVIREGKVVSKSVGAKSKVRILDML